MKNYRIYVTKDDVKNDDGYIISANCPSEAIYILERDYGIRYFYEMKIESHSIRPDVESFGDDITFDNWLDDCRSIYGY